MHGPLDVDKSVAPRNIRVGLVGTPEHVEGVQAWLNRCRHEIPAKRSRQPNLFPLFPGFNEEGAFRSTLILDGGLTRSVPNRVFDELLAGADHNSAVTAATEMFLSEFRAIKEQRPVDVLLCAVPMQLVALIGSGYSSVRGWGREKENQGTARLSRHAQGPRDGNRRACAADTASDIRIRAPHGGRESGVPSCGCRKTKRPAPGTSTPPFITRQWANLGI